VAAALHQLFDQCPLEIIDGFGYFRLPHRCDCHCAALYRQRNCGPLLQSIDTAKALAEATALILTVTRYRITVTASEI
jgi:hypothetical protein